MMEYRRQIKLSGPEDVREFVRFAERCDFDINVFYNRFIVDAKSILGVFSLDLSKDLTVEYSGIDAGFENMLTKYCVA
ncbi:HPr family phosphocarrier protein [Roseburia hominis]